VKFKARISGDGECFCLIVDTETYIKLLGQERYDEEVQFQKESCKEIDMEYVERTEWCIDPGQILKLIDKDKDIEIEITTDKKLIIS